ncbi:MAG: sigma-70 family RNA polymerase sigma factor [Candidatus Marinimicrobia bacterium]|jgi:RNA polymerase sigma-70 factor (ECF subfamily)|nr:sigma-70 family RNA polymerase sigma factor [Candidatus Neomarinimicrobiota bacterium]MBT3634472.1 sigma-70 family RNA polymerase sigma factor [Candidatus Neomarinimicrobiota bacterium]MBT3683298.1 sigma-70 family RNA polymerase sigma factor [Candidatus Neomarinimicrobiota bacterium]MBT3760187.1 sigma-70 family RNA polymerase sigma factor [Candidatus Neomarinimicrobiota bacterium]MBT3896282.1 sigma-70 family RNA polymerase sigma factor [Candidatus Neomarinimicrobiota bacterium]
MNDDFSKINRYLAGDDHAFDELVNEHQRWVFEFIIKIVNNPQDAEDLAQDIFVKVFFNLQNFRFQAQFKTWLYRIIINQLNNYFKKKKLLSWFNADLNERDTGDNSNNNKSNSDINLVAKVKKLPKVQRDIVILRIFQDMSFKQVSEILTITENSAKVSFYKAKINLKGYINAV